MDVILSYVYTYRAIQHSSHHVLFAIDFNLIYFTPVYSGLTLFPTCSLLPIVYYSNNNLLLIILVNQSSFRHSPFYSMLDSIIRLSSHKNHNSSSSPQSVQFSSENSFQQKTPHRVQHTAVHSLFFLHPLSIEKHQKETNNIRSEVALTNIFHSAAEDSLLILTGFLPLSRTSSLGVNLVFSKIKRFCLSRHQRALLLCIAKDI